MQTIPFLIGLMAIVALLAPQIGGAPHHNATARIVGGNAAWQGQYPSTVSLHTVDSALFICAGSIISERWTLTAAHCMTGRRPAAVRLRAGSNRLHQDGRVFAVSRINVHAGYVPQTRANDLATVQISSTFRFDDRIAPIALQTGATPAGESGDVVGWGYMHPAGQLSDTLRTMRTLIIGPRECQAALPQMQLNERRNLCTLAGAGRGICHGDSGGPLIAASGHRLLGVVSQAVPCATGVPDVHTRVAEYVAWIVANAAN